MRPDHSPLLRTQVFSEESLKQTAMCQRPYTMLTELAKAILSIHRSAARGETRRPPMRLKIALGSVADPLVDRSIDHRHHPWYCGRRWRSRHPWHRRHFHPDRDWRQSSTPYRRATASRSRTALLSYSTLRQPSTGQTSTKTSTISSQVPSINNQAYRPLPRISWATAAAVKSLSSPKAPRRPGRAP